MAQRLVQCGLLLIVVAGTFACASARYMGNASKGFSSDSNAGVSPSDAYQIALPYLAATWKARCAHIPNHTPWCVKEPTDHMVRRGDYYYVTRTSYPYKTQNAYLRFAVRVHVDTGEVIPLD